MNDDVNIDDLITLDEGVLAEIAELSKTYRNTLLTLEKVINANVIRYSVEEAMPVEVVGLRHELRGTRKMVEHIDKYARLYERNKEQSPNESPPAEDKGSL